MRTRRLRGLFGVTTVALIAIAVGEIGARTYFWTSSRLTGRPRTVVLEGQLNQYDSRLGYRLVPNATGRLQGPEFDTTVAINAAGLRQQKVMPYRRQPGVKRILVAGDSFTFGHGVNVEDRFTERLEAALPNVEIINTGVWGTGTDQQMLFYLDEGVKYQPDLTILCYMVENIVRNAKSERLQPDGTAVFKPRFALDGGKLTLTNVPVPPPGRPVHADTDQFEDRWSTGVPIPFKRYLRSHSALYDLVHRSFAGPLHAALRTTGQLFPEYDAERDEWRLTSALITTFFQAAREKGSDFLLVVIPTVDYVSGNDQEPAPNQLIAQLAKQQGIRVLDLLPGLKEAARGSAQLYFREDGHWTGEGHRVAADLIRNYLIRDGMLQKTGSGVDNARRATPTARLVD